MPKLAIPSNFDRLKKLSADKPEVAVYVIRHGSTPWNSKTYGKDKIRGWVDLPLDEEGVQEAHRIGRKLKAAGIDRMVASDLGRTRHTAAIVADHIGHDKAKIVPTRFLRPWNLGVYQGQESGKIGKELTHYAENMDDVPEGGESFQQFLDRFIPFLRAALKETAESGVPMGLVCHYRNLKVAEAWYRDGMRGEKLDPKKINAGYMPTGAVLKFSRNGGKWDCSIINGEEKEIKQKK